MFTSSNVPGGRVRAALIPASLALFAIAVARPAGAQGTAASQGFGYPTAQLGSRAAASVGAFTEFDETTPLNPAALLGWRNAGLHFQYEPEFRTTEAGGSTIRTAINRVPVVLAALPIGSRAVVALSLSSLLDRTWSTDVVDRRLVGAESLYVTEISSSDGGMNDIRVAGAFRVGNWLDLGIGAHAIVGLDRFNQTVLLSRTDPRTTATASTEFSPYGQSADIRFSGSALSLGAAIRPYRGVSLALSARRGESVKLTRRDTALATARVPDRVGVGLAWELAPRTIVAGGADWTGWSSLAAFSTRSKPQDALGLSIGIETPGPRFAGRALTVRGGFRHRALAYDAPTAMTAGVPTSFEQVRENSIGLGLSAPFAYDRALIQVYGQRALRSVAAEKSFTIGVGVSIRP
ncbi:MAG TPA: hypothetical protein VG432_03540 [Gemmatimonadaceae bacterium]|nr:hypothetical protein [Gemmatimonadaceae bacterium]